MLELFRKDERKMAIPRSVEWKEDSIKILNQQLIPNSVEFLTLETIEDVWDAIKTLKVRGAPAIGIAAAFGLALAGSKFEGEDLQEFHTHIREKSLYLASSRPTAVNLTWALRRLQNKIEHAASVNEAKTNLVHEAILISVEDENICYNIGQHALSLFNKNDSVMTICNAGSIATAYYGTALAPFHLAAEVDFPIHVFACETRPLLQGARLTTWELLQSGVNVTLITDSMAAHTMKTKKVDAVIVGADRISANGDTANKIGTYGLAILAKQHGIPFYVAAPLSTFDISLKNGDEIPIEERKDEEILKVGNEWVAPKNTSVYNPAFDVTPAELISGIITEQGIIHGTEFDKIPELFTTKSL